MAASLSRIRAPLAARFARDLPEMGGSLARLPVISL